MICSTIIDNDNFSILTSQRLLTKENGLIAFGNMKDATDENYGHFKEYKKEAFTFGKIQLSNGKKLKCFIETGTASMVMIYGVRTLILYKA